jgi:hypothetical protein
VNVRVEARTAPATAEVCTGVLRGVCGEVLGALELMARVTCSNSMTAQAEYALSEMAEQAGYPFPIPLMKLQWASTVSVWWADLFSGLDAAYEQAVERLCGLCGVPPGRLQRANDGVMKALLKANDEIGGRYSYARYSAEEFLAAMGAAAAELTEAYIKELTAPLLMRACGGRGGGALDGFDHEAFARDLEVELQRLLAVGELAPIGDDGGDRFSNRFSDVLQALFALVDFGGGGAVAKKDFKAFVKAVGGHRSPSKALVAVLGYVDRKGSGEVGVEAFVALLRKLLQLVTAVVRSVVAGLAELLSAENVASLAAIAKRASAGSR